MRNDKTLQSSPPIIYKGDTVTASYSDPAVSAYRDNPFNEALPPILSVEEAATHMAYYPPYDKRTREYPPHLRYHEIQNSLQLFSVLSTHLDLEQRVSRSIRGGYVKRNPLTPEYRRKLNKSAEFLDSTVYPRTRVGSMNTGFSILGISGIGKSRAIHEILSLYPQVIIHNRYKGRDFTFVQFVWMKLDCPPDGSVRGLCLNFFQAVDAVIGTSYHQYYKRCTANELRIHMARVAAELGLGLLVIDEIQNLSEAASGGRGEMLNFFVNLNNGLSVPVILIGTYAAYDILTGEFRQIRRGTGQGDLIWDRMSESEINQGADWDLFIKDLWLYQYTKKRFQLTDTLNHALYFESQGITDMAAKIYMIAQIHAISSGKETVNEQTIQFVAKDHFRSATKVLSALKTGDTEALFKIRDVKPIDIGEFLEENVYPCSPLKRSAEQIDRNSLATEDVSNSTTDLDQKQSQEVKEPENTNRNLNADKKNGSKRTKKRNAAKLVEGSLLATTTSAKAENESSYDALLRAGFIGSANEYLPEE